jgi:hypothetical protein
MKSNPIRDEKSVAPANLIQFIRESIFIYVIFAVSLPIFCIILGWRTSDEIGTGFIIGSLCMSIFGTLILFGNTVLAQLSKRSLPKYSPPSAKPYKEAEIDGPLTSKLRINLFLISLFCGALLLVTGLILK